MAFHSRRRRLCSRRDSLGQRRRITSRGRFWRRRVGAFLRREGGADRSARTRGAYWRGCRRRGLRVRRSPRARHESSRLVHQSVARAGEPVVAAARRGLFGSSKFLDLDGVRVEYAADANASDEGALEAVTLAYALAGTALTLAGAGAGLWATNAWVIDKSAGEVAAPAAAFARVAARALGATLLQFCTADAALGGALASIALVSAVAESARGGSLARALSFFTKKKDESRAATRGERAIPIGAVGAHWSDSTTKTKKSARAGGSRRIRRRVRAGAPAVGPRSFRGPRAVFAGADASARGLATRSFPESNRATRRTRHRPAGTGSAALLVRDAGGGGGAATAGTGPRPRWTPNRGPRPWCSSGRARARWARLRPDPRRRLAAVLDSLSRRRAPPLSFGLFSRSPRAASASRDSDSQDDADGDALLRERHRAAAAAAAGARRAAGRSGRSGHALERTRRRRTRCRWAWRRARAGVS